MYIIMGSRTIALLVCYLGLKRGMVKKIPKHLSIIPINKAGTKEVLFAQVSLYMMNTCESWCSASDILSTIL
jgi:hypothetical protein